MSTERRYALRPADLRSPADDLGARLPRVGLAGVLADLDRAAEPCAVPGPAAGDGLTWDARDRADRDWMPQGVACLRGDEVLLVSWYGHRRLGVRTPGARVTVVDRTDPRRPRYAHVLLVVPRRRLGVLSFAPVRVHAGGIAVLGDLLYVADTFAGVRVFRLSDVVRVPRRPRLLGGGPARGHRFALPQELRLRVPPTVQPGRLRYSFLSLGRVEGRLSLVVGEYGRQGTSPRLVRYLVDPQTGLPVLGEDGACPPVEVHEGQPHRMQGVAVDGPTWWVTASAGEGNPGDLHVGRPGAFRRYQGVLPTGPEDLDWAEPGRRLWCTTEWPGRRWLFPVDATAWEGPGGA